MTAVSRVTSTTARARSALPTLRLGARGTSVKTLQTRLRAHGLNVAVDGSFGPKTLAAVKAFQRARGLTQDGVVGPATWGKLNASTATSSRPVLRSGAKGAAVKTLQTRLRAHGLNVAVDGSFGPKTLAAVKSFQRARGLAQDGVVGPATWARLDASPPAASGSGPVLRQGARGNPVKQLQSRLNKLGFKAGTVDGSFGPTTLAAVKAFQRTRGLAVDGVVGPATWKKLGIQGTGSVSYPGGSSGGGTLVTGYVNGVPRKIRLKSIPNGKMMRSDAADAYNRMYAAARRAGITLKVNSGFRSMAQQQYLYNLYVSGRGNLAARPGYSNHQGGIAVDVQVGTTSSSTYRWLANNAHKYGFRRTVPSEPWHWEYRP